ncbi:MAG TPA: hypothetical protein VFL34_11845, partial [Candidatus Sulfotelmatobacter sp.]|nr:hypothetical protein [Candidatus Sulfotelmatobacter sp.]
MQVKKLGLVVTLGMIAAMMGCGGGSKSTPPPPPPTVTAITVTPATNVITTTGSVSFKAEANYSDGTQADITSSAAWSASPSGVVTLSGSTATAAAKGAVTITATSGTASGSAVINVTDLNLGNGTLSAGSYAFQLRGIDSVGAAYAAGTIISDGSGNITGGEVDLNTASGVSTGAAPFNGSISSGTYTIGMDGRGTMSVTYNGTTIPFLVVISHDGSRGKLIESDGKATVAGTFERQTSVAQPSGISVFRLTGLELDSAGPEYMGEIGVLTVSGSTVSGFSDGNIRGGHNWAEQPVTGASLTAPDAQGRGTVTLTFAAGVALSSTFTVDFVYYVVSASKFYLVSTDSGSGMELMAGQAESQATPAPLAASDYTFLLDHAATPTTGTFEKTGRMTLSGLSVTK